MKRVLTLLMVLALSIQLAACNSSNSLSAYEVYAATYEGMGEITSLEAKTSMQMTMTYEGESMTFDMDGVIKEIIHSDTDIELSMLMATNMEDQSIEMNVYFKDGYYYMDVMGMKYKASMPLDTVMEQVNVDAFNFEEAAVKEQKTTDKDGGQELYFVLDGAVLSDVLAEQLGSLTQSLGEGFSYNFNDVAYTVFVDGDGVMKTTDMNMSFDMVMGEETIPVEAVVTLEYVNINGDIVIDYPEDLEEYVEVDASALGM